MSKLPSDATQLRSLKSEFNHPNRECASARQYRDMYRARAIKAEQDVAQWKERFDILLRRDDA